MWSQGISDCDCQRLLVWKWKSCASLSLFLVPAFIFAQLKLTICSIIKDFKKNNNKNGSTYQRRAEAISGHIVRWHPFDSWVTQCGCHDNWVRPPIKPTSAVISSPKSFVIALICILQLSVLAHSKNNQPSLKTGDRIIIISVDLYKTPLTSLWLTSALCRQPGFSGEYTCTA